MNLSELIQRLKDTLEEYPEMKDSPVFLSTQDNYSLADGTLVFDNTAVKTMVISAED